MKDLTWVFLFSFVVCLFVRPSSAVAPPTPAVVTPTPAVVTPTPAQAENYTIYCNGSQALLSINKTYLSGLLFFLGDSIYLINQSDPQQVNTCKFTENANDFTFVADYDNLDTCFVQTEVQAVDGRFTFTYVAQYFPVPATGQDVIFDSCYQWTFRCTLEDSYNISTATGIDVIAPEFGFNTSLTNISFDITFLFYEDGTYTTELNSSTSGIAEGDPVFTLVELTAAANFEVSIVECNITNDPSGEVTDLVAGGCPTSTIPGVNVTRLSSQRVGLAFPAFLYFPPSGPPAIDSQQMFTVTCTTEVCDTSATTCPMDDACVQMGRKRRSIPMDESGMMTSYVSRSFYVHPSCHLPCKHKCSYNQNEGYSCTCDSGYLLQADGFTCKEIIVHNEGHAFSNDDQPHDVKVVKADQLAGTPKTTNTKEHNQRPPKTTTATTKKTTTKKTTTKKTTTKKTTTKDTTTKKTTTPVAAQKADHPFKPPKEHEDASQVGDKEEKVVDEVREVMKASSVLFYGSIAVMLLLCVFILVSIVKKCRKPRKPYAIMSEEGS